MKPPKKSKVKAAGVVLMTRSIPTQFLLMRHPKRWDLPKGHCDGNESFREAAVRELEEETGISPDSYQFDAEFRLDFTYDVTYKKKPGKIFEKTVRYFLAFIPEAVEIRLTEHEGYEWKNWSPPHQIQSQTIDPLLNAIHIHLSKQT